MMSDELELTRRDFVKAAAIGAVAAGSVVSLTTGALAAAAPPVTMGDASGGFGKIPPITARTFPRLAQGAGKISAATMTRHFALYNGYVNKVNEIVGKLKNVGLSNANQTFSDIRELKVDLTFALGGVFNHELYFSNLGGKGGEPEGNLAEAIKRDFGSFASFKADMKATGVAARGWVWLAATADGRLFNYLGDAQNTFPVWGAMPVLALDTYEHAYWLDTANRGEYIDNFFDVLDWGDVARRCERANRGKGADDRGFTDGKE